MLSNEIFLRAEIDRLEAEILWLKFELTDLKNELAELKGKPESQKFDQLNWAEAQFKQDKTTERVSG